MAFRSSLLSAAAALLALSPGVLCAEPGVSGVEIDLAEYAGQLGPDPGGVLYGEAEKPRFIISIIPQIMGPALVTGEVQPFLGGGLSFCFNFVRSDKLTFGVDGGIDVGVPFETDSESDTLDGTWVGTSIGFPLRVGSKACFFLRPGICVDILDYYNDGYTSYGDHWEDEINDVGVGIVLCVGFEINMRAFGFGFIFSARFLPVSHEVQEWWNGTDDGSYSGWLTIHAGLRFMIRF